MAATCALPIPEDFPRRLRTRMIQLSRELKESEFLMPVGLVLAVDEKNGGDATAKELVSRFNLLDFESRNIVDFYFLGWREDGEGISFSFEYFTQFRTILMQNGIKDFGGNADLILVDAHYKDGSVSLNFEKAIRIDLSTSAKEGEFATLGAFLQSIIAAAEQVESHPSGTNEGLVFSMSDQLGLAVAKSSMLDFILDKWGKIIGAKKLKTLAVRNLGPHIPLEAFQQI